MSAKAIWNLAAAAASVVVLVGDRWVEVWGAVTGDGPHRIEQLKSIRESSRIA